MNTGDLPDNVFSESTETNGDRTQEHKLRRKINRDKAISVEKEEARMNGILLHKNSAI